MGNRPASLRRLVRWDMQRRWSDIVAKKTVALVQLSALNLPALDPKDGVGWSPYARTFRAFEDVRQVVLAKPTTDPAAFIQL